ncbi:MAG: acyltransferase [Rhizobiales bacterium]|nr:acyltransferase [Hyphomicrobiales bacterium]
MTETAVKLSEILESRSNSFNALRLLAATSVVVSHSFLFIGGSYSAEPLSWSPYTLGQHAVNVFFVLSGVMLSHSFTTNPDWRRFAAARILRIFPGLLVCGVIVGWLFGAMGTSWALPDYFSDAHTLFYPVASLLLFNKAPLHDVFQTSTQPGEINTPLWTIKYELLAYICFSLAVYSRLLSNRSVTLAGCVVLGSALTILSFLPEPIFGVQFARFGFSFSLGVVAYQYRSSIKLSGPLLGGLLIFVLATNGTPAGPAASIVWFAYAALVAGSLRLPGLTEFCSRIDLSYGIYIYSWPLQQLIVLWGGNGMSIALHAALSLLAVLPFACFSWFMVEKPALAMKQRFGEWRGRMGKAEIPG